MPSRRYETGLRQIAAALVSLHTPSSAKLQQISNDLRSIRLDAIQIQHTDLVKATSEAETTTRALIIGEPDAHLPCVRAVHRVGELLLLGLKKGAEKTETAPESTESAERKILVVDDSRVAALALADAFRTQGFTVRSVATMTDALNELRDYRPSVLISDVFMPNLDLRLLCRSFRESSQAQQGLLVLISGSSGETVEVLLDAVKPDAFVPKMSGTGAVIQCVMGLWQQRQEAAAPTAHVI